MFKFIYVKYKIHPKINRWHEQWYLLIDTQDSLDAFLDQRSNHLIRRYLDLKKEINHDRDKNGNYMTDKEDILITNRLMFDGTRKTVVDDCKILDELLNGYVNAFHDTGKIVINSNNGFRTIDDTFQILETRINKGMVFPTTSEKDIKVSQWPNGKHWYVRIDNYNLPDKYSTHCMGFEAGKEYLKEADKKN